MKQNIIVKTIKLMDKKIKRYKYKERQALKISNAWIYYDNL